MSSVDASGISARKSLQNYSIFFILPKNFEDLTLSSPSAGLPPATGTAVPLKRVQRYTLPTTPPNIFTGIFSTFTPNTPQRPVSHRNQQMLKICCKTCFYSPTPEMARLLSGLRMFFCSKQGGKKVLTEEFQTAKIHFLRSFLQKNRAHQPY